MVVWMRRDHRLLYLNAWPAVGGAVGKELGGVPLRVGFEVWKPLAIPSDLFLCASLLAPWLLSQYVSSQLLLPCHACLLACCCTPYHGGHGLTLRNCKQTPNEVFSSISCLGFCHSNRIVTKTSGNVVQTGADKPAMTVASIQVLTTRERKELSDAPVTLFTSDPRPELLLNRLPIA